MVKIIKLLTSIGVTCLGTLVAGYKGECEQFKQFLKEINSEITIKKCTTNDAEQMNMVNLTGQNISQIVIDKIATYKNLETVSFNKINNYPANLDFKPLHIKKVSIYNLGDGRRNIYSGKYLQSDSLKTLKNIENLRIAGYNISQNNINDISTLTNLKHLEFFQCGYDKNLNYNEFKSFKNLEYLYLTNYENQNSIGEFPEVICKLKKLQYLQLTEGTITTIPKCISNLKKLEILDLFSNNIKEIPVEFSKLTALVELNISHNNITTLPTAFGKLPSLQNLYIDNNSIKIIPNAICQLKKIQKLNISNNVLTSNSVPNCIKNLSSNLLSLDLNQNQLTSIPNILTNLKQLQELNIAYNMVTSIPSNIKNLTNLKTLNLNSNKITTIPESIGNLKKLEHLNLSFNEIFSIPESLGQLTNLKYLHVGGNKLTENDIPESLKNIEELMY